jgi:hypothetical protein
MRSFARRRWRLSGTLAGGKAKIVELCRRGDCSIGQRLPDPSLEPPFEDFHPS